MLLGFVGHVTCHQVTLWQPRVLSVPPELIKALLCWPLSLWHWAGRELHGARDRFQAGSQSCLIWPTSHPKPPGKAATHINLGTEREGERENAPCNYYPQIWLFSSKLRFAGSAAITVEFLLVREWESNKRSAEWDSAWGIIARVYIYIPRLSRQVLDLLHEHHWWSPSTQTQNRQIRHC